MKIGMIYRFVIFLVIYLLMSACAETRQIAFPGTVGASIPTEEKSISVSYLKFELQLDGSAAADDFADDTDAILRKRFEQHLIARGLFPNEEGFTNYYLNGSIILNENSHTNGLIARAMIVAIGLMPIGVLIAMSIPTTDLHDEVIGDITLIEQDTGATVFTKTFRENIDAKVDGWGSKPGASSKLNRTLSELTDRVMSLIAEEIALAVLDVTSHVIIFPEGVILYSGPGILFLTSSVGET